MLRLHIVDCCLWLLSFADGEDMHACPEDSYGIAKLTVEQDLRATHRIFGLPCVIFRPHNVFGPAQNIGDRYRNVIGIFMNCAMQDRPMPIFGSGEQTPPSATSMTLPHI